MIRTYLLPLVAVAGIVFALTNSLRAAQPVPPAPPVAQPVAAPYAHFIAGAGIVEASTENIAIAPLLPGVVAQVHAKVGDAVKAGDPLFTQDAREAEAQLAVREAELAVRERELEHLRSLPRPEDIPPLEARVKEAAASLEDLKNQLALRERVSDKRAVSEEEIDQRRFAVSMGEARLREAKAQLDLMKAGAYAPEIAVAEAGVAAAKAAVQGARTRLEQHTVRAPIGAAVLQVKVRAGEYAAAGPLQQPLMLLGGVDTLHVRVDIDEHDAWRLAKEAPAMAYLRGNTHIGTALQFVKVEPYVVPKRSLTGESTERVDTRVLQALYSFPGGSMPIYVGQQVDVYIEAPPILNETPAPADAPAQGA